MAITGLTLEPLRADQYRQVAEWEYGPQPENTDWELHAREMEDPRTARLGLYLDGEFVGCVSLEQVSRNMVAFHIATRRHAFHPDYLARLLFNIAGDLFKQGATACVAHVPIEKRAVTRLALRCGMHEWGHSETTRYFMMTKTRFQKCQLPSLSQ